MKPVSLTNQIGGSAEPGFGTESEPPNPGMTVRGQFGRFWALSPYPVARMMKAVIRECFAVYQAHISLCHAFTGL